MSFFITFYVPFEVSWKGLISDKAESSGRCITLAVPIKLQIIFFFLAFELGREKKRFNESFYVSLYPLSTEEIKEKSVLNLCKN